MAKSSKLKARKLKLRTFPRKRKPRQTAQLLVRITPKDMKRFKSFAQHKGLSMSAWARMILRQAVQAIDSKVLR